MTDLSDTIIAKSDQLNADDLIGITKDIVVTKIGKSESVDQPITINYEGDNGKPFKPCKSMRRVLVQCWGADGNKYVGRTMRLYRDEKVKYAGKEVGGIRISHLSDIDKKITMMLTETQKSKKPYVVEPLSVKAKVVSNPDIDVSALQEAGNLASSKGLEAYKQWASTLAEEEKEPIKKFHNDWVQKAKQVDVESEAIL